MSGPPREPGRRATSHEQKSAGDPFPPRCAVIEVHVAELKQLFNAIDPSPFREKDLDPNAEEFIVGWARELPHDVPLGLLVYLDRPAGLPEEATVLRAAVQEFFRHRADGNRQRLRELLRRGRTSLAIGIAFLALSLLLGNLIRQALQGRGIADVARESLLIGGWVAMWRPLEIFLYDWWPIRREARLSDRLAAMPVRIAYTKDESSEAWRWDWPAVSPATREPAPAPTIVAPAPRATPAAER